MNVRDQIQQDLKEALKAKDEIKVGTLRMVSAAFLNKEKEKGEIPSDEELQNIVLFEAKKRKESMTAFEQGGRPELVEKEKAELEILQTYLPEQLSEEEVRIFVEEAVTETGASSPQDMGKVMAAVMPKVKGKADGTLVNKIVKEALGA